MNTENPEWTGGCCHESIAAQAASAFPTFAFLLSLLLFLFSCATAPVTERRGLHLVPDSELATMSYQEYNNVLKKSKLSTDMAKVSMVRRVGQRIATASEQLLVEKGHGDDIRNYKWEFNLIEDDKTVNAWCMPGGKVAVYTGLLPISQDENGLAVVMGHEVAHAIAKHGNERMSQGLLAQFGAIGLSVALAGNPGVTSDHLHAGLRRRGTGRVPASLQPHP